jgi:uncharacterized membrane protein YfcA
MLDFSNYLNGTSQWVLFFLCAVILGMTKTGIQGLGILTVPVFAYLFGAKNSTGILLPIICFADLMAILYYRTNLKLKNIFRLLPWTLIGLVLALLVDHLIPATGFKQLMAFCIILGLVVMFWSERKEQISEITDSYWYAPLFGLMVGFATMIGNAAGPILTVYLLSMRLPKYEFVSTAAWFIMFVNLLKVPLQVFVWDNISLEIFLLDLYTIPFLALGAVIGVRLVKIIPEKLFRKLMIVLTVLSTLMLLL